MTAIIIIGGLIAVLALGLDQVFSIGWTGGSAPVISSGITCTGDTSIETEFTLGTGTVTDQEQDFGFNVTAIKGIIITVTGNTTAIVTMETNDTTHASGQILTFPIGGGRYFWDSTFPTEVPCAITPAVTKTFWTKSAAETPLVKVRVLYNA